MKFNIFKRKEDESSIQEEWNANGEKYAAEINKMVEFVEENGWESWTGKEPEDNRTHLADKVIEFLRKANLENKVDEFRMKFPPGHSPFIKYFEEKGQSIDQIHFIENEKIVFLTGTAYQKRQAFVLNGDQIINLDERIDAIGKSKRGNIFAIQIGNNITTTNGWQGKIIAHFKIEEEKGLEITQLSSSLKLV